MLTILSTKKEGRQVLFKMGVFEKISNMLLTEDTKLFCAVNRLL